VEDLNYLSADTLYLPAFNVNISLNVLIWVAGAGGTREISLP
jgi:hypothetical protein